jgi:hypothetical protein
MTRMPPDMPTEWYFQAAAAQAEDSEERFWYEWIGRAYKDARAFGGLG